MMIVFFCVHLKLSLPLVIFVSVVYVLAIVHCSHPNKVLRISHLQDFPH